MPRPPKFDLNQFSLLLAQRVEPEEAARQLGIEFSGLHTMLRRKKLKLEKVGTWVLEPYTTKGSNQ